MKKILKWVIFVIILLSINLGYYVFFGQEKSTKKLTQGKELNLYECVSIYQMHIAVCSFGLIYSPIAAKEIFNMSFSKNRDKILYEESDFFLKNELIQKLYKTQFIKKRIAFKDSAYSINNPNHELALAANPGFLWRTKDTVYFEVPVHYPSCKSTHIDFITINECLFTYLEDKYILHPYTIIYYYPFKL